MLILHTGMFNVNLLRKQHKIGLFQGDKSKNAAEPISLIFILRLKTNPAKSTFLVQATIGDGNCFFYSCAYALLSDVEPHPYSSIGHCFAKILRTKFAACLNQIYLHEPRTGSSDFQLIQADRQNSKKILANTIGTDCEYISKELIPLFGRFVQRNILVVLCNNLEDGSHNPFESYIFDNTWPFIILQWDVAGLHVSVICQNLNGRLIYQFVKGYAN
jgi:hypothetical protein